MGDRLSMEQAEAGTQACWNHLSFSSSGQVPHPPQVLLLFSYTLHWTPGSHPFQGQGQALRVRGSQAWAPWLRT